MRKNWKKTWKQQKDRKWDRKSQEQRQEPGQKVVRRNIVYRQKHFKKSKEWVARQHETVKRSTIELKAEESMQKGRRLGKEKKW